MKKILLSAATAALLFAGCSKEELGDTFLNNETLSATIVNDEAQTRTTLNNQLQVVWSTDDEISVFAANGDTYSNNKGTLQSGAGTTDATFSVTIEGGTTKVAAAYPYAAGTSYTAEKISMTMPDSYTYSENVISGAPMAAKIYDQSANIAFKNAGALMGLTVNNIPAGYNKAILTSETEAITGACEITFDDNGNPTLKTTTEATGKTITINFSSATTVSNKTFYFPIPVNNYTKLKFAISNGTDTKQLKEKALNAARSVRYKTTLTLDEVTGSIPEDVIGTGDANTQLALGQNTISITIPADESTPTITLPKNNSTHSTSLSFEPIPDGKTISIKESEGGSSTGGSGVSENVYISASSNGNNNFEILLPNSTVSLKANGETATYKKVVAHTAANTLIIEKGVTVTELEIGGGNVRVYGTISSLSRSNNNADDITYIICETGASIPTISDAKIKVVSAAEYDLLIAFKKGDTQTITLTKDVKLYQPLTLNKEGANITIDLGEYSITNETAGNYDGGNDTECYVFDVQNGTLNIKGNGSVKAIGGSDYDMAVFAHVDGKVNISGGKFTNKGKENGGGSDLIYSRDNAAVTISGGEFEAGNISNDVGNQYVALNLRDANRSTASIKVTGGKFHKFNPANNKSEGDLTNFTTNNTMVTVSGNDDAKVYEVIDLTNGYTLTANTEIATPIVIDATEKTIEFNLGTYSLTNKTAYNYDGGNDTECYVFDVQKGTLNIKGNGSVKAIGGSDYDMAVFAHVNGKVNISGGKFTNKGKENGGGSDLIYAKDNAAVTISGGEFEAGNISNNVGNQYVALNLRDANRSTASIKVTGGKFHKFNPANNKSEGDLTNFTTNNTMVTVSGNDDAKVYEVIDLTNGYTLKANTEIATPIVIDATGKTIEFDLETYSLTNKTAYNYDGGNDTECYVFDVQKGTLNIKGNGSVKAIGGSDYDMAVFAHVNGKVNISGGKFTNKGKENDGSDLIYAKDNAAVTISGGEFEAGNKSRQVGDGSVYVALNLHGDSENTASISVTGGIFHKFNPANPGTESAAWNSAHSNGFVSDGYSSSTSDSGKTYVIASTKGE